MSSGAAELAHYAKRKIMKVKELPVCFMSTHDFLFHSSCTSYGHVQIHMYIHLCGLYTGHT